MNHHVFLQLKKKFSVNLVQNINPPFFLSQKIFSKLFRMAGLKGCFPAFTERRLNKVKSLAEQQIDLSADGNFFHGATPWLNIKSALPYYVYLDCCFATYINVYQNQAAFSSKQLETLFKKEALFLKNAKAVFFSSSWAKEATVKNYKLAGDNFYTAGLGGGLTRQKTAEKNDELYFLFIALDFAGKGGDKVFNAFTQVLKKHPSYKLKIAGQQPPAYVLSHPAVEYAGMLDKSTPKDFEKLVSLFSNAYCFVLPTSKDMTPLVLVEAGSVGCPVIATNNFGIPEIVKHNETGFLLRNDFTQSELEETMITLCNNSMIRNKMGDAAYDYINSNFNWDKTGDIICKTILFSEN